MARRISISQIPNQICQVQRKYKQALRQHNYGKLRPYLNKVALSDSPEQGVAGSRMPRTDMNHLLSLFIPLPLLTEQQRIAAIVKEQMVATEKTHLVSKEELKAINALPAILLHWLFGGIA